MIAQNTQPSIQFAETCCRCCGAVLPQPGRATRLDQVPRNEHAKRAIEVALAGGFSIALTGTGMSHPDALALAQVARGYGITAFCLMPCPCGFYGDAERACTCTPRQIERMRASKRYQTALLADIHTEVVTPPAARLGMTRPAESDEHVLERVAAAKQRTLPSPDQHDNASESLMRAAVRQLDLSSADVVCFWQVAAVIAQLAASQEIRAAHLAESVQYRRRDVIRNNPVL